MAGVSPLGESELSTPASIIVDGYLVADLPAYETTVDNTIYGYARKAEVMEFSPDGSKMYFDLAHGLESCSFVQYDLATPWDPRTLLKHKHLNSVEIILGILVLLITSNSSLMVK